MGDSQSMDIMQEGELESSDAFKSQSTWDYVSSGYQEAVDSICRPERDDRYSIQVGDLGPPEFMFRGGDFVRRDLELINTRGETLQCSHWMPASESRVLPCVIYLHRLKGSRRDVIDTNVLAGLLHGGFSVFAFDLSGAGKSDGEWTTWGWFEKDDVAVVLEHLGTLPQVSALGVWGVNTGAVAAAMHYARKKRCFDFAVMDALYVSFEDCINEALRQTQGSVSIPKSMVSMAVGQVLRSVRKKVKAPFTMKDLSPKQYLEVVECPGIFLVPMESECLTPKMCQDAAIAFGGEKQMLPYPKDLEDPKNAQTLNACLDFLRDLHITQPWVPEKAELSDAQVVKRPWASLDEESKSGGAAGIATSLLDAAAGAGAEEQDDGTRTGSMLIPVPSACPEGGEVPLSDAFADFDFAADDCDGSDGDDDGEEHDIFAGGDEGGGGGAAGGGFLMMASQGGGGGAAGSSAASSSSSSSSPSSATAGSSRTEQRRASSLIASLLGGSGGGGGDDDGVERKGP